MRSKPCLRLYWGWPRLYNTWSTKYGRWDEKPDPIDAEAAARLVELGVPVGFRQCYAENGNNCAKRDLLIFEYDAKTCPAGDMACVVERAKAAVWEVYLRLKKVGAHPLMWYNGGHSIYIAVRIFPADLAKYAVKKKWIALAAQVGMDAHLLQSPNAFRNPCTPHPETMKNGRWLDELLKPIPQPKIPEWPDWNIAFFDPVEREDVKLEPPSLESKNCGQMKPPADPQLLLEVLKGLWPATASAVGQAGMHHRLLAALTSVAARRCIDISAVAKELLEWAVSTGIDTNAEARDHMRTVEWFYANAKRYGSRTFASVVEEAAKRAGQDPQAVVEKIIRGLGVGGPSKEKKREAAAGGS